MIYGVYLNSVKRKGCEKTEKETGFHKITGQIKRENKRISSERASDHTDRIDFKQLAVSIRDWRSRPVSGWSLSCDPGFGTVPDGGRDVNDAIGRGHW